MALTSVLFQKSCLCMCWCLCLRRTWWGNAPWCASIGWLYPGANPCGGESVSRKGSMCQGLWDHHRKTLWCFTSRTHTHGIYFATLMQVHMGWWLMWWWPFSRSREFLVECSTIHSPPALFFFFWLPFFSKAEISLCTLYPLFMPESVHSGSANWGSHTMPGQPHSQPTPTLLGHGCMRV